MSERVRTGAAIGVVLLASSALPAFGQSLTTDPALGLAAAADADASGDVTAAEWSALRATLGADADGVLQRETVVARMIAVDLDGDGALTRADVDRALAERRTGGLQGLLLRALADTDHSGGVSDEERAAFVGALAEGPLPNDVQAGWVAGAATLPPPENPNAMVPGVIFATIDAGLDRDADGKVTLSDVDALFASLDTNGDGALDAAELNPAPTGGTWTNQWAVSADERSRPPLMPWQRTLDDALALSEATGKPLLLCVNIDGENASESLAWGRYRDPEFAALAAGFIPVLASPDTHTPRARDDRGRRLPDPRFGRLLDSEHIDVEPLLFERYFDGRRVAPRHVGVSPEGEILFDVFLVQDLSIVDEKLRQHGVFDVELRAADTLSVAELLMSPDAGHRDELERRFVEADEATRALLANEALASWRAVQHPELVRLALRDSSVVVRHAGAWSLIQNADAAPLDEVPAAYAEVAGDPDASAALVAALENVAANSDDAARRTSAGYFARVFADLGSPSAVVDAERWRLALALAPTVVEEPLGEADLESASRFLDSLSAELDQHPDDAELLVHQAAAFVRLARVQMALGRNPSFFFEDAIRSANRALELAPDNGRALGLAAWSSYMLSDPEAAAELAARALPHLLRDAGSPLAKRVLEAFASLRTQAIYTAMGANEAWPEGWVPDAIGAHEALLAHPGATEQQWRTYLDLLGSLSAYDAQAEALQRALAAYPLSADLHNYLRFQMLRDSGARALEAAYEDGALADARTQHGPTIAWFHGLATLIAAEQDVNNGNPETAVATYRRCVDRFQDAIELAPDFADSASHYQALALAGAARLHGDAGHFDDAVELLSASFRTAPGSLESSDGLGETPAGTARSLSRSLRRAGAEELAEKLRASSAEAGLNL